MADNPKKYELVAPSSGLIYGKVPRWLLSALHAMDKIVGAKWGPKGPGGSDQVLALTAYNDLRAGVGTEIPWTTTPYTLDTALAYQVGGKSLLAQLSDAMWIREEDIAEILAQQWEIWNKGKKPSDPSKALLEIHGLAKKGGGVSTPLPEIPPTPGPKPTPVIPPSETEEGGFPWWILAVAGVGAAWFFLSDREKKKRRVIGSRI